MRNSLLLFFSLLCSTIFAQKNAETNIEILSVNDNSLFGIIDTFLYSENKCNYYSDTLLILINCWEEENSNDFTITIESSNRLDILMKLDIVGCFCYDKHLILIEGHLHEGLFTKTEKIKIVKYNDWNSFNDKKNKVYKQLVDVDSFSIWSYLYKNRKFIYLEGTPNCPR